MKINGIELEFDIFDMETAERFEQANTEILEKISALQTDGSLAATIGQDCALVEEFFDHVFGEGTAEKLFKGKRNLKAHLRAYSQVIQESRRQGEAIGELTGMLKDGR